MSVTKVNNLKRCLADGEGPKVEFKEARNALPRDLFETVCAFLNRDGGTILLGVADDGTVTGVEPDAAKRLITDIVNLSNNPQKLDPPHGHGPIRAGHFTPFSKNPTLSKIFMQMGRGEELGSGVLNVNKYLPFYTRGAKPRFVEGDLFTAIIPLPGGDGGQTEVVDPAGPRVKTRVKKDALVELIAQEPSITREVLAEKLSITIKSIRSRPSQSGAHLAA